MPGSPLHKVQWRVRKGKFQIGRGGNHSFSHGEDRSHRHERTRSSHGVSDCALNGIDGNVGSLCTEEIEEKLRFQSVNHGVAGSPRGNGIQPSYVPSGALQRETETLGPTAPGDVFIRVYAAAIAGNFRQNGGAPLQRLFFFLQQEEARSL